MATAIKLKTKPLECKPGTQSLNLDPSIRSQNDLKMHSSSLTAISHSYIFYTGYLVEFGAPLPCKSS